MIHQTSKTDWAWRRQVAAWLAMLVILASLAGCAAGAPGLATDPTATSPSVAQPVIPSVAATVAATNTIAAAGGLLQTTATVRPTRAPSRAPTATQEPEVTATPEPGPTARPEPPPPDDSGLSVVYQAGLSGRREVALTFDAGSDRGYAEQILDTLAGYRVVASFGITGSWAEENPDLVERMVAEGHMVFNHTYSHRSFTGFSTASWGDEGITDAAERTEELDSTARIIAELTGYEVAPYFRPPYGDLDDSVLRDVADAGYRVTVMWSCDSLGWNDSTAAQVVEQCGASAAPGDIILLHVGSDSVDAAALPGLIAAIQALGLEMVTVETLLQP